MKSGLMALLLLVALVLAGGSQAKTTIPLKVKGTKSLISVKVGDVVIPDILLDTGFAYDGLMIYNPQYKDSLDLSDAIDVRIGGAGSGEASKAVMIDSAGFWLGDLELVNQRLIVITGDVFKGFPSNGLIGYSMLGHYVTEIDYDLQAITLWQPGEVKIDTTWTAVPLYFKGNEIPWLDASIVVGSEPPTTVPAYIDFAAADPVLILEKPDRRVPLPSDTASVYIGRGLSGDIYGKAGTISKLAIGPYELSKVKTYVADERVRSKQEGADAILGSGALSRFNLIFDYADKRLYLKPNSHFGDPFN